MKSKSKKRTHTWVQPNSEWKASGAFYCTICSATVVDERARNARDAKGDCKAPPPEKDKLPDRPSRERWVEHEGD